MVSEGIYIEKGRAVCYICNKKIDEDVFLNDIDKRYYCSEEHAINGKNIFLEEQRLQKEQIIRDVKLYEDKINNEIKKALKKGFKPAKSITLFKAITEIWDTHQKNLSNQKFLDLLRTAGSFQTIVILKNIVGKTIFKEKNEEILCKYKTEGIKNEFSILIELDYPKHIDFLNFDKYKIDKGQRIPLVIFNTSPAGKVVITRDTIIKIVHDNPHEKIVDSVFGCMNVPNKNNLSKLKEYTVLSYAGIAYYYKDNNDNFIEVFTDVTMDRYRGRGGGFESSPEEIKPE